MSDDIRNRIGSIGPDIDLDETPVTLSDGTVLDEAAATALGERVMSRRAGRPSVSGDGSRTPALTIRVPVDTREALERIAASQGRRLADVGRDALAEYVANH